MNLGIIVTYFFLLTNTVMAANTVDTDYFKSIEKIKQPPINSIPILASNIDEKKHVLNLMKNSDLKDFEDLKLTDNGNIVDRWNQEIEIYKGNFSNEGITEYALVSTGGSIHANTVTIYKLIAGHLEKANLNRIIINNLMPGGDMNSFYLHVADPFAITKNGKTYLRFMSYPGKNMDYDKTKLRLCTYLWQGEHFVLTGPNWRFTKLNDKLVPAKDCIA